MFAPGSNSLIISIHAPREGGDFAALKEWVEDYFISIHAPREGGATSNLLNLVKQPVEVFQSTPPARGATTDTISAATAEKISIHAPREGGDHMDFFYTIGNIVISIHAPREGGDNDVINNLNSTDISIHAPREGGDQPCVNHQPILRYFNPRPPRGGRRFF